MSSRYSSQLPSGYDNPLVCRGRQTTARGGCNVIQRHDKISMKISKCAISKQHIQNGRPSRYQDVNERKKSAKLEQKRKHVRKYQKIRKKNEMEKKENSAEEKINPIGMLCHLSEKTPESEERRQRPSR